MTETSKMLLDLPVEILKMVIAQVTSKTDLKSLCEASKSLYTLVIPFLWRSIIVRQKDDKVLKDVDRVLEDVDRVLKDVDVQPLLYTPDLLRHVRHIRITAKSDGRYHFCPHKFLKSRQRSPYGVREDDTQVSELVDNVMPLLEACTGGCLESFSWELGVCVPQQVLGPTGYLPRLQNAIESIRLITHGRCVFTNYYPIALSAFQLLKKLSWLGLGSEKEFETLRKTLQQIASQLVELELDFVRTPSWYHSESDEGVQVNFFARDILGLSQGAIEPMFPALRMLSLSVVPFTDAAEEIASAFDFSSLRSLKLRRCPGCGDFLQCILNSNEPIGLKSLEIEPNNWTKEISNVSGFLKSFQGLEDLFISAESGPRGYSGILRLWGAVRHHKSTLKRVSIIYDTSNLNGGKLISIPRDLDLECIGLCPLPNNSLEAILSPLTERHSLQVLQIRQSVIGVHERTSIRGPILGLRRNPDSNSDAGPLGTNRVIMTRSSSRSISHPWSANDNPSHLAPEMHNFAQWAFGPKGLPSLRVLAFGRFSDEYRCLESDVLLCRDPSSSGGQGFRYVDMKTDPLGRDVFEQYGDFLQACPYPFHDPPGIYG